MNFYTLDFEEQGLQEQIDQEQQMQDNDNQLYDYEPSSIQEQENLHTFDGYLQEEPVLLFNYVEEQPKKKSKTIVRKSKKIRKYDSETDIQSQKKSHKPVYSSDLAKLQQCQLLKTIISQMETILQQTRTQILNEYIKKQKTTDQNI